jgi:hypothetical protein
MPQRLTDIPESLQRIQRVRDFTGLIEEVGRLCHEVQHDQLLFRGQDAIYAYSDGSHSVRPRLYRDGNASPARYAQLRANLMKLYKDLELQRHYAKPRTGREALLAHYRVTDTRMLDCTHVLHVAASFALASDQQQRPGPSVVYALDVRGGTAKPATGQLGKALVAATTGPAATRPMRQGAWVTWQHGAGLENVDFGGRVVRAFVVDEADKPKFWDCTTPHEHEWLMADDDMSNRLRRL